MQKTQLSIEERLQSLSELVQSCKEQSEAVKSMQEKLREAELEAVYSSTIAVTLMDAVARQAVTEELIKEGYEVVDGHFEEKGQRKFEALTEGLKKDGRYFDYTTGQAIILNTEVKIARWLRGVLKKYAEIQGEVKAVKARTELAERAKERFGIYSAVLSEEDAIVATALVLKRSVSEIREALGM